MSTGEQHKRQYIMAARVREALGAGAAADVMAGRASPAGYRCLLCDKDGVPAAAGRR